MGEGGHLIGDGTGGGGDFFHGGGRVLHDGAALIGGLGRLAAGAGGVFGIVADLADGGGHLLGGGGNLVGLAGLGVSVAGALDGAGADLGGGGGEGIGRVGHRLQDVAHGGDTGVEGGREAADFIGAGLVHVYRQVFLRHAFEGGRGGLQRWDNQAGEHGPGQCAEQDDQEGNPGVDPGGAGAGAGGSYGVRSADLRVDLKSIVRGRESLSQRRRHGVRREKVQRIPGLPGGQQTYAAIARILIQLDCRHKLQVLIVLFRDDQRLHLFQRIPVIGDGFLAFRGVVRRAGRPLTQHQLENLTPFDIDAVADAPNENQGGKMVSTHIRAFCGNVAKHHESVGA